MELILRGLTYHDEGQIVYAAHQILRGFYPYKDFHFIYTPLSLFITSVWFLLFRESLFSGRMLTFFTIVVSSLLLFRLLQNTAKNWLIPTISSFLFFSWAVHINFPWPVTFAVFFGLLSIWSFQKKHYFLSGIVIALTVLSKQNFGLALIFSYFSLFVALRFSFSKKTLFSGILGFCIPFGVFTLYLLLTHSLFFFFDDMYRFSVEKIILEGVLTTPFWYGPQSFFYLLFPITSLVSFGMLFKKRGNAFSFHLLLNLFAFFFYLFGIRPTTDYVHLVSLFGLIAIPLATIHSLSQKRWIKNAVVFLLIAFTFLGFYTAFFKGYYRWESPLVQQTNFLTMKKAGIYTDSKYSVLLPPLLKEIQAHTKPNDYLFVYDYAPLLYFLSDRENPTKWNILQSNFLNDNDEKEVIKNLDEKKVSLIIASVPIRSLQNSLIETFILRHFTKISQYGEFSVYIRN